MKPEKPSTICSTMPTQAATRLNITGRNHGNGKTTSIQTITLNNKTAETTKPKQQRNASTTTSTNGWPSPTDQPPPAPPMEATASVFRKRTETLMKNTTANMERLALSHHHTQQKALLSRNAYHGWSTTSTSGTTSPSAPIAYPSSIDSLGPPP